MKCNNFSTVNNLMAILANRFSITYIVPKLWIIFPLFYMMGVYFVVCAASLAGIIISGVNSLSPFFIFVSVSFFSHWFSGSFTLTNYGAVLIPLASFLPKFFFTPFTRKHRDFMLVIFYFLFACVAIFPLWFSGIKLNSAYWADYLIIISMRFIYTFIATVTTISNTSAVLTNLAAFFAFGYFSITCFKLYFTVNTYFIHIDIIPYLERFFTATGITPELVG